MSVLEYAKDIFVRPELYRKFWIAAIGALLVYLVDRLGNSPELTLVTGIINATGVFIVPNGGGDGR